MDVAVRRSVGAEGRKADVEEKKRRRGEEGKAGAGRTRQTTGLLWTLHLYMQSN